MTRRHLYFGLIILLSAGLFWAPLKALFLLSLGSDYYSQILLVPFISAFFIYFLERKEIFSDAETSLGAAAVALLLGAAVYWVAERRAIAAWDASLSFKVLGILAFWMAGFLASYGVRAARSAAFSLAFLLLMVPIPDFILSKLIYGLQVGSTEVTYSFFRMLGIPVFRQGFVFTLPNLTIEVAKQCSGIHSCIALFVVCILSGHIFLHSSWRTAILILAAAPILIVKNAMRIVLLSLLAVYVDPRFLTSPLHTWGGVPFFLLALVVVFLVIRLLERPGSGRRLSIGSLRELANIS